MRILRIQVILIVGCILFLSCKNTKMVNTSIEKNQSLYYSSAFNVDIFVNIRTDTAIVDWFYEEVIPRYSFSDTLFISKFDSSIWVSDISKIYLIKKRLFLETKSPYKGGENMHIRLKLTENTQEWLKKYNLYQNIFYLRKASIEFETDTTFKYGCIEKQKLWHQLISKYRLEEKIQILDHDEFLNEFEKFKLELLEMKMN